MSMRLHVPPAMWYENDQGDRFVPPHGEVRDSAPSGFIYYHHRSSYLHHRVDRVARQEQVERCFHGENRPTGGWIDGVEGRECVECLGTQTRKVGDAWPEKWSSGNHRRIFAGEQGWQPDLVLAMTRPANEELRLSLQRNDGNAPGLWGLKDAIAIAAVACEACGNSLAWMYGLSWGYPEGSEEWKQAGTSCELCRESPTS